VTKISSHGSLLEAWVYLPKHNANSTSGSRYGQHVMAVQWTAIWQLGVCPAKPSKWWISVCWFCSRHPHQCEE